jgi:hypothetical protein
MDQSSEILVEFPPVFRIYKDLRVDRLLGTDAAPAGYDITTGVTSRDVSIDGDTGVYVRLFLPDTALRRPSSSEEEDHGGKRLPVVVFYHGGGFVAMSPASPLYKAFQNSLAGKAGAIVVSVNYRLATEHPFPVGYEDSFHALEWVLSSGGGGGDPGCRGTATSTASSSPATAPAATSRTTSPLWRRTGWTRPPRRRSREWSCSTPRSGGRSRSPARRGKGRR